MAALKVKVFTPAGLLFEESTDHVKVPTVDGEIGILDQHTKYSGLLGDGVLELSTANGAKKVSLSGGLIQVAGNVVTVLADQVRE